MNSIIRNSIFFFTLITLLSACKKEPTNEEEPKKTTASIAIENERLSKIMPTATTAIFLKVIVEDEDGKPMQGVQIVAGNQTHSSDPNGHCFFNNISINKDFALISAQKNGFFKGFRTFPVTTGAFNTASITLVKKPAPVNFSASQGGELLLENNTIKLSFPPNAIVDRMGKTHADNVQVYAKYIDPRADDFSSIMPGTLVGLTENNTMSGMISYGMLNVELTDMSGNPLQLAEGKSAKITMPAILDAPDIMPYWHFNETYGVWVQAGKTNKKGQSFEFDAYSFSAWNLDIFVDDGEEDVTIDIIDERNIGVPNKKVQVFSDGNFTHKSVVVHTDEQGRFRVLHVPRQLGFRLFTRCENIDRTSSVTTPITSVNISLTNKTQLYQLNGTIIDCDNAPISNAHFFLQSIDQSIPIQFVGKSNPLGQFNVAEIICDVDPLKNYSMIAQVFGAGNSFKRDTFEMRFTGDAKEKNIDFCKSLQQGDSYAPGTVHCTPTPTAIVEIMSPVTGKIWMDRNLGATKVASAPNDTLAFGDLYQWGRRADGHQCRNSNITSNLSPYDKPPHADFIINQDEPNDWRTTQNNELWQGPNGINNPCPSGFRVPTEVELEMEINAWSDRNESGAYESFLKMTMAGGRNSTNGAISPPGTLGRYWTNNIIETGARTLAIETSSANWLNAVRGTGRSVRCIKH
jgi:hypothetical protein